VTENELATVVVDVTYMIHRKLGPGLFESVYHAILLQELKKRGLLVESKTPVPVVWDDVTLDVGFYADLIIEGKLVVELKSLEMIAPVHKKQLLTYLRLTNCRLGLLINFGSELIGDGVTRVVNGLIE
jgi:GxxExxY protein